MRYIFSLLFLFIALNAFGKQKVVNVYAWTGEIPEAIVRQFEAETHIKVNFSTYENNEIMYTKLRTLQASSYDVIMPSSYFVDRMRRQGMLQKLDKNKLPNWKHLNSTFLNPAYDPKTQFSVPFIWGITGIFVNDHYSNRNITSWKNLWNSNLKDQIMLLDDMREIFSMALLSLGYSVNDNNPAHIKAAFLKLKALRPNIKVFSTETVISMMIDEDASVGMAWNGDAFKAMQENMHIKFVYPSDGFAIWVDNFAIPKEAHHREEAYAFINYMLHPDVAKRIAMHTKYPITNLTAQHQLPTEMRNNATIYPSKSTLKRGQFQTDLGENALALMENYWEELKMGG